MEDAKKNPKLLEEFVDEAAAKKILDIILAQKKKSVELKKEFCLSSIAPNGIILIKEALKEFSELNIIYLTAGKFVLTVEAPDKKIASQKISDVLNKLEVTSKKNGLEFSYKEK